jgi:hypothetical protein
VDVLTSAENLDSSLAFAQKFFIRLEDYGHRVVLEIGHEGFVRPTIEVEESVIKKPSDGYGWLRWSPRYRTIAYLGTVAIGLTIAEMTEVIKDSGWRGTKTVPSGRLRLQVYSPYRHTSMVKVWQDTKEASLRSQLDQIIGEMEQMSREIPSLIVDGNRRAEEELKRREAEDQEYLKRLDIDERKRNQKESRLALDELIASWAKVRDRLHFVAELEAEIEREDDAIKGELRSRL